MSVSVFVYEVNLDFISTDEHASRKKEIRSRDKTFGGLDGKKSVQTFLQL